jgi:hypothetical protein
MILDFAPSLASLLTAEHALFSADTSHSQNSLGMAAIIGDNGHLCIPWNVFASHKKQL